MDEDGVPQELERLVEGELGKAVLEGFSLVLNAALGSMVNAGEYERIWRVLNTARANAADVVIPEHVAPEMQQSYRTTIAQAVEYAWKYAPEFRD